MSKSVEPLAGQAFPMLWDYVETDPLLTGPANLWDKLDRIIAGTGTTPRFAKAPTVHQGRAQSLPFAADSFDAVITDPPYYDNIYYNVLADFFYSWKRPVLLNLCPDLFQEDQCNEENELVSSPVQAWGSQDISRLVLRSTHTMLKGGKACPEAGRNSVVHIRA